MGPWLAEMQWLRLARRGRAAHQLHKPPARCRRYHAHSPEYVAKPSIMDVSELCCGACSLHWANSGVRLPWGSGDGHMGQQENPEAYHRKMYIRSIMNVQYVTKKSDGYSAIPSVLVASYKVNEPAAFDRRAISRNGRVSSSRHLHKEIEIRIDHQILVPSLQRSPPKRSCLRPIFLRTAIGIHTRSPTDQRIACHFPALREFLVCRQCWRSMNTDSGTSPIYAPLVYSFRHWSSANAVAEYLVSA